MSMPFVHVEPEIDPDEPHNVVFKKLEPHGISRDGIKYFIEKPSCKICGATEETETCNRTFYN